MFYAADPQSGSGFTPLLLIVLLFGVMYFMMIRPQQKRRREAVQMQSTLAAGDEVVTIGGLHATVVTVTDEIVTVEISPGVHARFARPAIAKVVKSQETVDVDSDDETSVDEIPVDEPIQSPVVETRKTSD